MRVGGWPAFLIEGPLRKLPNKPTNIRRVIVTTGSMGALIKWPKWIVIVGNLYFPWPAESSMTNFRWLPFYC